MTIRQRREQKQTPEEKRAFETAYAILEGSGLRYQSAQIDGLAVILLAYADREIELRASKECPASESQIDPQER